MRVIRLSLLVTAATVSLLAGCSSVMPSQDPSQNIPDAAHKAGVQLFQYNWNSVAKQCIEHLGPNQIGFVILSPAQEHVTGEQWWTSYQPVSYQIESKLGSRSEFRAMVDACHTAGVSVIADAVINHMAGTDSGIGVAGSSFTHYDYPGIYTTADFHHCGLTTNDDIANYSDQQQVQTCELVNLADLDTAKENVREQIVTYLEDLRSLGVDGFRIDAAKHIAAADVAAIVERLSGDPMIISEVIRSSNEPVQPEDYLDFGGAFAFGWSRELSGIVKGGSLKLAMELRDGEIPSDKAFTFVANHDTERSGKHLNPDDPHFTLAQQLMLAVDYGTPVLYSGYAFTNPDQGAPSTDSKVSDAVCATQPNPGQYRCLPAEVLAMARWRALVGGEEIRNQTWADPVLSFDRGTRGFVAFSAAEETQNFEAPTGLPDGTYCNLLQPEQCDVSVADGKVRASVAALGAIAITAAD